MRISQCCPKSPKTPLQIVTNHMSRNAQLPGNLFCRQPLVVRHLQNLPLPRFQAREHLLRQPDRFGRLPYERTTHPDVDRGLQVLPVVEVVRNEVTLPVEGPVVRILQYPHFRYAPLWVKIRHGTINVQKNRLNNLFRFTRVSHNPEGDIENQAVVTVKENRDGVLTAGSNAGKQLLVREQTEVLRRLKRPSGAGKAHVGCDRKKSTFSRARDNAALLRVKQRT
jgi:hypothetical protein